MTKASDNAYPSILITEGTEPAAPAAGKQRLYIDSTTHKLKRTDSSGTDVTIEGATSGAITSSGLTMSTARLLGRTTASTGAIEEITVGSGLSLSAGSLTASGGSVPGWLSWFVGTTDSNNFYWDGNDLAGFTAQTVSGSATWVENGNSIQCTVSNQTADDVAVQLIAHTFSVGDAYVLAINSTLLGSDVGNSTVNYRAAGLVFTDGTTTTSNCVIAHLQVDNGGSGYVSVLVGRHGTLTAVTSAPWVSQQLDQALGGWIFAKLTYQASNTFRVEFGTTPYQFSAFGEADISKTMTPTHVGLLATETNAGTALVQFGPLLKVA